MALHVPITCSCGKWPLYWFAEGYELVPVAFTVDLIRQAVFLHVAFKGVGRRDLLGCLIKSVESPPILDYLYFLGSWNDLIFSPAGS